MKKKLKEICLQKKSNEGKGAARYVAGYCVAKIKK